MSESEKVFPWAEWRERLIGAGRLLLKFAANPIEGMRHLPDWDWIFLLACQAIAAAAAGLASGIVAGSFTGMLAGLIIVPISNALLTAVVAGFFYYTFAFVFKTPASYQRVYLHLVFAQLPSLIIFAVAPMLPPLMLLGPAAAGLLLLVGFVDNLGLDRKKVSRLLLTLYGIFVVFWIVNSIHQRRQIEELRYRASPESMDILENEIRGGK